MPCSRPIRLPRPSGSSVSGLPTTTEFAAAQFEFGIPSSLEKLFGVVYPKEEYGLAVFGGRKENGQFENRLWIGKFKAMDDERNPYCMWEDRTPKEGPLPPARKGAHLVASKRNRSLILYGGELQDGSVSGDLWSYSFDTSSWREITPASGLPQISGAEVIQKSNEIIVVGGTKPSGDINTNIYRMGLLPPYQVELIGTILDGPGARKNAAIACQSRDQLKLLVFGGIDNNDVIHNDLWEYNLETGIWTQLRSDCDGERCPKPSQYPILISGPMGRNITVHPSGEHDGVMYYKMEDGGQWMEDREIHGLPPETDCDGDGVVEADTTRACRNGDVWYAEVGRLACANPETNERVCTARQPIEMSQIAEWTPESWEWIVDFAAGENEYDYVLTDGRLYTFDVFELGAVMQPIDEKEIKKAYGETGADWGYRIEANAENLFVASMRGMHVFSLEDPASPVEVGFLPGHGKVRDISVSGDIAFLADDKGITVVDIRDPEAPVEIGRKNVGKRVEEIELNEKNGRLYVLTPSEVIRYETMSNPREPIEKDAVRVRGSTYQAMRLDGNWIYLDGIWTESIYDDKKDGMMIMGEHDVSEWVQGRIVRDGQAERVQYKSGSSFEVWGVF